jgi:hypothetical protein
MLLSETKRTKGDLNVGLPSSATTYFSPHYELDANQLIAIERASLSDDAFPINAQPA